MMAVDIGALSGFLSGVIGNYTATRIGRRHYEDRPCSVEVFDIGHQLLPQIAVPPLLLMGLTYAWVPFLSVARASEILRSLSVQVAIVLALRAITTTVTVLPKSETCDSTGFGWSAVLNGACYDKVFSGHTAFAVLVSLALVNAGVWPVWGGAVYSALVALVLLVSRGHYTVDVVLGLAIGWLTWHAT